MSRSTNVWVTGLAAATVLTVSATLFGAATAHAAPGDAADCNTADPVAGQTINGRFVIVGTSGDDELLGTSGPDIIFGMGGNDFMKGGKGDDILCASGSGKNTMFGGSGDDLLVGGTGDDTMYGGGGNDNLVGGGGANILNVGSGRHNTVDATGDGADKIFGHLN